MKKYIRKLLYWTAIVASIFFALSFFMPTIGMAIALTGLMAAVMGTVIFGEERMPFVVAGIVFILFGNVDTFHHMIQGMEWVLFVKLVALLTWVDFLSHSKYFDYLIERYLPRQFHGFKLIALLLLLAGVSAALIDEVNSIVLWYAVVRAIIGFTKKGIFKVRSATWVLFVILLVSATNIGSQFLPLGNPVGIAISVLSGLNAVDFIKYAWVPGMITLIYFIFRVRTRYTKMIDEFKTVAVEAEDFEVLDDQVDQYEVVEYKDTIKSKEFHEVEERKTPIKVLHWLFGVGVVGLIASGPLSAMFGYPQETGLGMFVLMLFAVTLFIASGYGRHTEIVLSELPWNTLFFIVFLFGIAHGLEKTGLTVAVAEQIIHYVGNNPVMVRVLIVLVGALVTAFMDNVIAIAVIAPIITALGGYGLDTTGLWFSLLSVAVVAGNLTPIGSAANIIANARIRTGWGRWWQVGGVLGLECLVVNQVALYVWEMIIL